MSTDQESHIYPVKQYIGARYVPIFGRKNETTIEWDNSKSYEPLTIVLYQGNSYTSKQYVPQGAEITDEKYWALTGNYNAQVEQYRKEVASKIETVAHDDTLKGAGISSDPLKTNLNHSTIMSDTNNTVYPTLMHKQDDTNTILGIGLNAGDGLVAYNTEDPNIGSGIKLDPNIHVSIENSENYFNAMNINNTNTAQTFATKVNRNALYVGNSYTLGIGSSNNKTGIYELTKFIFGETNIVWGDGIGFMPYAGHTETFITKYQKFITENPEKSQKLTDIVVVSAYGDTRALIAKNNNGQYAQELITALNNFISLVHTNSPKAMVHVVFAEGTSQENKGGVTVRKEFELDNIFAGTIAQLSYKNIRYLGWPGWNITHRANCFSGDGYHPNDHGYDFLATSFIESFFGTFQEFKDKTNAISINLNNSSQENALTTTLYVETCKNYSYYHFGTIHVTKPLQITQNTQLCTFSNKICQPPVPANYILDFPLLYSTNFTKGAIDRFSISFDATGSNLIINPVGKTTSNEISIGDYVVSPYSVTLTHNA